MKEWRCIGSVVWTSSNQALVQGTAGPAEPPGQGLLHAALTASLPQHFAVLTARTRLWRPPESV